MESAVQGRYVSCTHHFEGHREVLRVPVARFLSIVSAELRILGGVKAESLHGFK